MTKLHSSCGFSCVYLSVLLLFCVMSLLPFAPCFAFPSESAHGEMAWTNNRRSLDVLHVEYEPGRPMFSRTILLTANMSYNNDLQIRYGCGFFCDDLNCDTFLFATFVAIYESDDSKLSDMQMVWSANRDRLVHENASLRLTSAGNLLLEDADGTLVWSTNTSHQSFKGMMIKKSGNLVLLNNSNGALWQSFDHPTDTVVLGQKFQVGQKLIGNISPTNKSQGIYYSILSFHQLSIFINTLPPQVYFKSPSSAPTVKIAYLQINPQWMTYYLADGSEPIRAQQVDIPQNSIYVKIDSDGHILFYSYRSKLGRSVVDYLSGFADGLSKCDYPMICGEYGVCIQGQCSSCPKGANGAYAFTAIDENKPESGCRPPNLLVCSEKFPTKDLDFLELEHVSYFSYRWENAPIPEMVRRDDCKSRCMENCSCKAAFFYYGGPSGNYSYGNCSLKSKVLSLRMSNDPNYQYYNATAYLKIQSSSNSNNHSVIMITVVVSGVVAVAVLLLWAWKRKSRKAIDEEEEDLVDLPHGVPRRYSFKDLEKATNYFKTKLGSGGFGSVYEGVLSDGSKVAVKRLDRAGQGTKEFRAEVETLGNIHHFHLVNLKGFCAEKRHRMIVYEYQPNGSLDKWIFPTNNQRKKLDWRTRHKVALHIARGLAYLHDDCEERIIHFDVKPQNILLDQNFNAKVSDFGLSKLINRDQSEVVTMMRGTPGYMAPELLNSHVTEKADTYSFGVVVVETVSGRRNKDLSTPDRSLLAFLQRMADGERLMEVVDPHLKAEGTNVEGALKMLLLGTWCMQEDYAKRPQMSTVVKVLEGVIELDAVSCLYVTATCTNCHQRSPSCENGVCSSEAEASVLSGPR